MVVLPDYSSFCAFDIVSRPCFYIFVFCFDSFIFTIEVDKPSRLIWLNLNPRPHKPCRHPDSKPSGEWILFQTEYTAMRAKNRCLFYFKGSQFSSRARGCVLRRITRSFKHSVFHRNLLHDQMKVIHLFLKIDSWLMYAIIQVVLSTQKYSHLSCGWLRNLMAANLMRSVLSDMMGLTKIMFGFSNKQ